MLLPRPERSLLRAVALVGASALVLAIIGAGTAPAVATTGVATSAVPSPTESPSAEPAPTDPLPAPTDPLPVDPSPAPTDPGPTPDPSTPPATAPPVPTPGIPAAPPPVPTPGIPAAPPPLSIPTTPSAAPSGATSAPPAISENSTLAPPTAAEPTAFAVYYPTNPWIYNGAPGTRYLDPRERDGNGTLRLHQGIDAQGEERQPIFAVAAGTVVDGTWGTTRRDRHGYGNQVEIAHADGYATRYAHLAEAPLVQPGDHVAAGQLIGYMGGSQRGDLQALDRHLHFEVTKNGANVDPIAFLGAAGSDARSPAVAAAAAPAAAGPMLYEVRPRPNNAFVSVATGLHVDSQVFTSVDMGGDSAQVMVSEGGTLKQLAVVAGAWTEIDTHLPLNATSISGIDTGTGFPELLAVEDGRLFHITGDASGWMKTWTGHFFSGTVSAVRMPGDRLHAMLEQFGYLYYLHPAQSGLWNVTDTGLEVGDRMDAVYVGGAAPEVMTVIDGTVHRIARNENTWESRTTGLPASGPVTTADEGGRWPVAISAEPRAIGVTRVVDGVWMRYLYGVLAPGPFDAVEMDPGTVLYSIG